MTLNNAALNETVMVDSIQLNEHARQRLQSLGMLPGTPLKVLHRKKSGTMVVLLRGNRFALGDKMSSGIEVHHV